jgi:hypothetical protein
VAAWGCRCRPAGAGPTCPPPRVRRNGCSPRPPTAEVADGPARQTSALVGGRAWAGGPGGAAGQRCWFLGHSDGDGLGPRACPGMLRQRLVGPFGILGSSSWPAEQGLAPTLQQVVGAAKQRFAADGPGCCWPTARASCAGPAPRTRPPRSWRTARNAWPRPVSGRLCPGAPAMVRGIANEPDWAELAQVMVGRGSRRLECAGGAGRQRDRDPGQLQQRPLGRGRQRGRGPGDLCRSGGQPARGGGDRPGPGPVTCTDSWRALVPLKASIWWLTSSSAGP